MPLIRNLFDAIAGKNMKNERASTGDAAADVFRAEKNSKNARKIDDDNARKASEWYQRAVSGDVVPIDQMTASQFMKTLWPGSDDKAGIARLQGLLAQATEAYKAKKSGGGEVASALYPSMGK